MRRLTLFTSTLLLAAAVAQAQVSAGASSPGPRASQAAEPTPLRGPKIVKIDTYAKSAPRAAMAVQFAYSAVEVEEGNAALLLYQALILAQGAERDTQWSHTVIDDLDMPLSRLSVKDAEARWQVYRNSVHFVELAAKKKSCDWGYAYEDLADMPIPPLSSFRNMSRALALKTRVHLARKEYDQAMETIRRGLAFARQVGSGTTLINGMVGVAQAELMLREVQEAMGQEGAINMYWALASLPSPLVDMRSSWGYERNWLYSAFPQMKNIRTRQMTPQQWGDLLKDVIQKTRQWGTSGGDLPPAMTAMTLYPKAKAYLAGQGVPAKEIEAMSASQAVMIYLTEEYEHWRDELFKWHLLPFPEAQAGLAKLEKEFQGAVATGGFVNPLLATIPTLARVSFVQAKVDRSVAALRTIEAIRIFAADNGRLPATLDEMIDAPAALNPLTGKAFEYKPEGNRFTLRALGSQEEQEHVIYEVTVAMKPGKASAATAPAK